MGKYVCTICSYVYDEAKGIPEAGIAPGTTWEQLPEDWVCPLVGQPRESLKTRGNSESVEKKPIVTFELPEDMRELSSLEMAALCTNLARGCEKQYKLEEAELLMSWQSILKGYPHCQRTRF